MVDVGASLHVQPKANGGFKDQLLKNINRSQKMLSVGHIQTIGLQNIKLTLGDRWDKFSEKVYALSENCIKKQLDSSDTFTRTEDNEFLICFSKLTNLEGLSKTQSIKKDIFHTLFGEEARLEFEEFNLNDTEWAEIRKIDVSAHEVEVTAEDLGEGNIEKNLLSKLVHATDAMKKMLRVSWVIFLINLMFCSHIALPNLFILIILTLGI